MGRVLRVVVDNDLEEEMPWLSAVFRVAEPLVAMSSSAESVIRIVTYNRPDNISLVSPTPSTSSFPSVPEPDLTSRSRTIAFAPVFPPNILTIKIEPA